MLWEMTRTNLTGSHDSRIMVRPMYEDCTASKNGKPEWHPSEPYLLVECSLPKAFYGQNIYGTLEDFQGSCERLREGLQLMLGVKLPPVANWYVQRIDWAENFRLPHQAVQEFFEGIYHIGFPRRRMQKHGNESIFTPGTTTTIKLYHKGPEFEKHDRKRLFSVIRNQFHQVRPKDAPPDWAYQKASRKVAALQRLANGRLRAEVEIHAEKFDYDFGHKPKVKEITTEYQHQVFDKEIRRNSKRHTAQPPLRAGQLTLGATTHDAQPEQARREADGFPGLVRGRSGHAGGRIPVAARGCRASRRMGHARSCGPSESGS
jgi:hypothetical protein